MGAIHNIAEMLIPARQRVSNGKGGHRTVTGGQSLDQPIDHGVRQKGAGGIVDKKNVSITSGCNPGGYRVLPLSTTR